MACTHGNGSSSSCSQCLGAPARTVSIVEGNVLVDGTIVGTTVAHSDRAVGRMSAGYTRKPGRARYRCALCGHPNHNARTCTQLPNLEDVDGDG